MHKNQIGKYYSFKLKYVGKTHIFYGYLLDCNKDWVLLKHNSIDYIMDGYIILKDKYITHYKRDSTDRFAEKLLDNKGFKPKKSEKIPITDIATILTYLTKNNKVFSFELKECGSVWVGKVRKIDGDDLYLDSLTPTAKWRKSSQPFNLKDIRVIEFDTDYINSLMLIAKKK